MSWKRPTIAPELEGVVTLGVLGVDGLRVVERDERLDGPIGETMAWLRAGGPSQADVAAVRAMYRGFGLDPTRRRPSSEALLRRVRKGEALPRINTLVDVCNWCAVEFQLPYGLYDHARIEGEVVLRSGRPGEAYRGIRKDVVHVAGRPTLADALGPFGNPTSDSARTMVTTETTEALVVLYAPRTIARATLDRRVETTASRVRQFAGGHEACRLIV